MNMAESEPDATPARRASDQGGISRQAVEMLIDEIAAQSFPASDPSAWGVAASLLEQAKRAAQPA